MEGMDQQDPGNNTMQGGNMSQSYEGDDMQRNKAKRQGVSKGIPNQVNSNLNAFHSAERGNQNGHRPS